MYRAVPAWFIRVTPIIDDLVKNNKETLWVPQFVGDNRFGNWLQNARDWNVSRNRYWGTPIPLWISDDKEEVSSASDQRRILLNWFKDYLRRFRRGATRTFWRKGHQGSSSRKH